MLALPKNWGQWAAGYIAVNLYFQLDSCALRTKFASLVIEAALKLFVATFRNRRTSHETSQSGGSSDDNGFKLVRRKHFKWQICQLYYEYLPVLTDTAIAKCVRELDRSVSITLLTPPDQEDVLSNTLAFEQCDDRRIIINSIDYFVSWRTLTASLDANLSLLEAKQQLWRIYQRSANACKDRKVLRIEKLEESFAESQGQRL